MPTIMERLATAFFEKKDDATQAIAALRQDGLAQIGVASHYDGEERKLAERTDTQAGVAVSPNAGGLLERTDEDSDYASIADIHGTLLAAGLSEHQATYFRERLEHRGILVTVAAPADRWQAAQRTLEEYGGDVAAEIPTVSGSEPELPRSTAETTTVVTPMPPAPVEPSAQARPLVESNIPNPAQPGTVTIHGEPGTPQSAIEMTRGMGPIELRGTLRDAHRDLKTDEDERKIA
ncbi:MAG: hypothetical protein ACRD1F_05510 [Terriglobales bacterium]